MASKNRKRRTRLQPKVDILEPIDLDIIGTKDDPCFGKLYDPKESECQRCGDSEICAICLGQLNHIQRAEIESTSKFKDLEEAEIVTDVDKKAIRKSMRAHIRQMVKSGGKEGVLYEVVVDEMYALFNKDGYNKKRIRKFIDRLLNTSQNIKLKLKNLVWYKP